MSFPHSIFRREMGFVKNPYLNKPLIAGFYNTMLLNLQCKEKDVVNITKELQGPNYSESDTSPIYDTKFCPINVNPHLLAAADEVGYLYLIDTNENTKKKLVSKYFCQNNANLSISWSELNKGKLAVGAGNNAVKIYDTSLGGIKLIQEYQGHKKAVKTVCFCPYSADIFASGSRDGAICVWDIRSGKLSPDNEIVLAHTRKKIDVSVTGLVFKDDHTLISCGSSEGAIKFWDLRKTYKCIKKAVPVETIPFPEDYTTIRGYSYFCLDTMNNLFASSSSSYIFKFNLNKSSEIEKPEACYEISRMKSFYAKIDISQDGRYLISGTESDVATIWDTYDPSPYPITYIRTNATSLCCVSFSKEDPLKIATAGDDSIVSLWRPNLNATQTSMFQIHGTAAPPTPKKTEKLPNTPNTDDGKKITKLFVKDFRTCSQKNSSKSEMSTFLNYNSTKSLEKILKKTPPSEERNKNIGSFISNLPNFILDGRLCHLPPQQVRKIIPKKNSWLGLVRMTQTNMQTPNKKITASQSAANKRKSVTTASSPSNKSTPKSAKSPLAKNNSKKKPPSPYSNSKGSHKRRKQSIETIYEKSPIKKYLTLSTPSRTPIPLSLDA